MSAGATWDILILTQPSRQPFLNQLMPELYCQKESRLIGGPQVGIRFRNFNLNFSLGENRDLLRKDSRADYISFFDDDDWPAPDYVASILPLLDGKVDQIGFRLQCYFDGVPYATTIHSLAAGGWK